VSELDERTRRIAVNETRFRDINDRVERDLREVRAGEGEIEFVCECGHADCRDTITMDRAAYESVREVSTHFALVSGHEITDVETVIETHENYLVVEKAPETHAIVEEADPRQP
jgi:hypothetical protein